MDFVAIDVELANTNLSSICQIGIVRYANGSLVEEYATLVDPQDRFFGMGIRKHTIRENDVIGKPKFSEIIEQIDGFLSGKICICHGGQDKSAIHKACSLWQLPEPQCQWINSQSVVRRTWEQFKDFGYGLENISGYLGIQYLAHDALEDAKAAALVMMEAINKTGISTEEWYKELNKRPSAGEWYSHVTGEGNPDGIFYGNEIIFTGFATETEAVFASTAMDLGFRVSDKLTKKNTSHCCHSDELPEATLKSGKQMTTKHAQALKWNKVIWSETVFRKQFLGES